MTLKTCTKCKVAKPVSEYSTAAAQSSGLRPSCKECNNAWTRQYRRANPEVVAAYKKDPPEVRKIKKAAHYKDNRQVIRERADFRLYGTTRSALLEKQDGRCAICDTDLRALRPDQIHIDHCHESTVVRGLLCGDCNVGLGRFKDSPQALQRAAEYVERFGIFK
ncbi:Recombination endonuclease VII [uncultured Caudovirales phage]|uniref:Recombination endonuclease VII n=1 Tax=uncultured Caudovirales phage TaxID=2100421 RepID=A0A6J7W1D1_9CAUD|nr:Recombination endonuclease VII [uncultured Caudovirales phage]